MGGHWLLSVQRPEHGLQHHLQPFSCPRIHRIEKGRQPHLRGGGGWVPAHSTAGWGQAPCAESHSTSTFLLADDKDKTEAIPQALRGLETQPVPAWPGHRSFRNRFFLLVVLPLL